MWRTHRSQNYLPYWSVGFLFGVMGWLINLVAIDSFSSPRMFWLIDISLTLVSVSAVTYGFLLRTFKTFNALWFFVAGFLTLHWIAYFSSVQIDHGLKMAISPLYVAVCMQLIVCIMWLKNKHFSSLEWAVALVCETSVILHIVRAYLYSKQVTDPEDVLLSAYDVVSFIGLPFVYTATGAALMLLVFNDKEISQTPLLDLKSGVLNSQGLNEVARILMRQCERSEQWVSVVRCKVNHLRTIKRHYGHATVEQILQSLALSLSTEVANNGYVGHLANNEFVILLPMTNEVEASTWSARFHLLVDQLKVRCQRELVPVTVSLGNASSCTDYNYAKLLLEAQPTPRTKH